MRKNTVVLCKFRRLLSLKKKSHLYFHITQGNSTYFFGAFFAPQKTALFAPSPRKPPSALPAGFPLQSLAPQGQSFCDLTVEFMRKKSVYERIFQVH